VPRQLTNTTGANHVGWALRAHAEACAVLADARAMPAAQPRHH